MNVIPRVIITAVLIAISVTSLSANEGNNPSSKTITVCRVELTGIGKTATFRFNYPYSISTDKDGSVVEVTKLAARRPEMIREDKMVECMRTWKLNPSSRYSVVFVIGTTSIANYISISDSKGESKKLILP
jgi:hypothetical protein